MVRVRRRDQGMTKRSKSLTFCKAPLLFKFSASSVGFDGTFGAGVLAGENGWMNGYSDFWNSRDVLYSYASRGLSGTEHKIP